MVGRVGRAQQRALDGVEKVLRDLGHEVFWRDPDHPAWAMYGHVLPRMARRLPAGADLALPGSAGAAYPHDRPHRGLISPRQIEKVRAAEPALAARVQSIFRSRRRADHPGNRDRPVTDRAVSAPWGVSTLALVSSWVPFNVIFNATGQPAAVVPWFLDGESLPVSVQLVGATSDEATLLALSSQIEAARPGRGYAPGVVVR